MRGVFLIGFSVLVAVLACGYCIIWFAQAGAIRQGIERSIAAINAKEPSLSYESLETSGFPSDVVVTIVKPRFKGRVDLLLKSLSGANAPATLPPWLEDAQLDGRIAISINALSSHYSLRTSGNWRNISIIGAETIVLAMQSTGETVCELKVKPDSLFASLWDFDEALKVDSSTLLRNFRLIDCSQPAYTITNETTRGVLASSGNGRIYLTSEPEGEAQRVRFYSKSSDFEIFPEGDKVITTYMQALAPQYGNEARYSAYGKQNIEIDFSYFGPSGRGEEGSSMPLDIQLGKFDVTNRLYNQHAVFSLNNAVDGGKRNGKLSFKVESDFSAQYDAMLPEIIRQAIAQLYTPNDPRFATIRPFIQSHTPEQLYAIVYPAVPNFHSLGHLVQIADISFQGAPEMTEGEVNIPALELSATPYGVTVKGYAKRAASQMLPEANLALSCRNCLQLIDDMGAYAMRLQKVALTLNPEKNTTAPLSQQMVDGLKAFLTALAEPARNPPGSPNFNYTLVSDGAAMSINGKHAADVLQLYNQHVVPALPAPPPAP